MTDSRDELRARFDSTRNEENTELEEDKENAENRNNIGNTGDVGDRHDWSDKYNYPFYMPREFANRLDKLYNQYDGKNKIAGGDGLEKHREFLFPIMEAAIEDLDLDEVIDWKTDEEE